MLVQDTDAVATGNGGSSSSSESSNEASPMPLINPKFSAKDEDDDEEESILNDSDSDASSSSGGFMGIYEGDDDDSVVPYDADDAVMSPQPHDADDDAVMPPQPHEVPKPDTGSIQLLAAGAASGNDDDRRPYNEPGSASGSAVPEQPVEMRPGLMGGGGQSRNMSKKLTKLMEKTHADQEIERSKCLVIIHFVDGKNNVQKSGFMRRIDSTILELRGKFMKFVNITDANEVGLHIGDHIPLDLNAKIADLTSLTLYTKACGPAAGKNDTEDENAAGEDNDEDVLGSFFQEMSLEEPQAQEQEEEPQALEREEAEEEPQAQEQVFVIRVFRYGHIGVPAFNLKVSTKDSVAKVKELVRQWVNDNGRKDIPNETPLMILYRSRVWEDEIMVESMGLRPTHSVEYAYDATRSLIMRIVPDPDLNFKPWDVLISNKDPVKDIALAIRDYTSEQEKVKLPEQLLWKGDTLLSRKALTADYGYNLQNNDEIRLAKMAITLYVKPMWWPPTMSTHKFERVVLNATVGTFMEKITKQRFCNGENITMMKLMKEHNNELLEEDKLMGIYKLKENEVLKLSLGIAGSGNRQGHCLRHHQGPS